MRTSRRRTVVAIVAIVTAALAAIVAGVFLVPNPNESRSTATSSAPYPKLGAMMLSAEDMQKLGPWPLEITLEDDGLGRPQGPGYATEPPGCAAVSRAGQATTYATLPWLAARRADYNAVGAFPGPAVVAAVVLTRSDTVASDFLAVTGKQWDRCLSDVFHYGTTGTVSYKVNQVVVGKDRITADMAAVDVPVTCQHIMITNGPYLIEAQSCGAPPLDVQKVVNAMSALAPT